MATYTKAIDLYRAQVADFERGKDDRLTGHRKLSEAGEKDLQQLLGGNLTPKQTRGAFARGASPSASTPTGRRRQLTQRQMKIRGIKGAVPLNPINVQSGKLRDGIALRKGKGGMQTFDLAIEDVEYARYVLATGGTVKMVARQVQREMRRRWTPRNKALLDYLRTLSK